ncbi:hypothetical protein BIV57_15920 [Mangrovactinospora gilvigrisea]|uniref:N-acetyltransferase domain-containing protein n=1 Tax=Mangrovactinospora gilvigrisea TaxID=1428644 RepID=A0A1J7BCT0_9ACTN|nr:hypothetical protein [Mangrovactinospora gilvigrisea]OIV36511.1 hypothetical protein BIV57_15920 [Mangrovactinospora gilvigrisea]
MNRTAKLIMRPLARSDRDAVLNLINADRLPGQPRATAADLTDALKGRSRHDAEWWKALDAPVTVVAVEGGAVVGVVSFAVRRKDDTGLILWLHCREREEVAAALVAYAVDALAGRARLEAFQFASALGLGLEGLPVRHRPATHAALLRAGFRGDDLWSYMRADLPLNIPGVPGVRSKRAGDGWELTLSEGGRQVAEASVSAPEQGIGVLRWLEAHVTGRGFGRAMLGSAAAVLAKQGAREMILYVDDDNPRERSRVAAKGLYRSAGFVEVDRLFSYVR